MEIAALIISIVSIIGTCTFSILEIKNSLKINSINLESELVKEIFWKYLVNEIPNARKELKVLNNGKISGVEKLQNTLVNMKNAALYYKFSDSDFYNELKKYIEDLEDYVINKSGETLNNYEQSSEFYKFMENNFKNIYFCINEKFKGKNAKQKKRKDV